MQRDRTEKELQPDYNVAPTKAVYAVLTRSTGGAAPRVPPETTGRKGANGSQAAGDAPRPEGGEPERQLRVVRWGLVPPWAKDPAIGSRMINARAETVAEKPAFRRAFARRRCLLPADGFYEWQQVSGDGAKRKQPYYIYRSDGSPLAFAGLYELWRDPSLAEDDAAAWLWTTTIITTSAPDEVGRIHDRMPMIVDPEAWQDWLDPGNTAAADARPLLRPAAASGLATYPVSMAVNSVRNNGPELIARLPEEAAEPPGEVPAGSGGTLF